MNAKEFLALKEDLEQRKSALARLQGKLEVGLQRLEKDFGCKTVAEAKKLLSKKDKEVKSLGEALEEDLEKFKGVYGESLER